MDKKYSFLEGELVGVLTTEPVNRILDYYSPKGGVNLGNFVEVNLGPRKVLGCIWSTGIGGYDVSKIKKINESTLTFSIFIFLNKFHFSSTLSG